MEQTWKQFVRTGKIQDYLTYCKESKNEVKVHVKEKEQKDGADHSAYRNGAGSSAHRGL